MGSQGEERGAPHHLQEEHDQQEAGKGRERVGRQQVMEQEQEQRQGQPLQPPEIEVK